MTNADVIIAVRCPRCGVPAGMKCLEAGRQVARVHPPRRGLAESMDWRFPRYSPGVQEAKARRRIIPYTRKRHS